MSSHVPRTIRKSVVTIPNKPKTWRFNFRLPDFMLTATASDVA